MQKFGNVQGPIAVLFASLAGCSEAPVEQFEHLGRVEQPATFHEDEPEGQEGQEVSAEEARHADLLTRAENKGRTYKDAVLDLEAAEALDTVAGKIHDERPDVFVGSALARTPGDHPIVYVKGEADEWTQELAASSPVPIRIEDNQPFSLSELVERKDRLHNTLMGMGFDDLGTGFDIQQDGRLESIVAFRAGLPTDPLAVLERVDSDLRTAHIEFVDVPVMDRHYGAFGGMRTKKGASNKCTTGWSLTLVTTSGTPQFGGVWTTYGSRSTGYVGGIAT